MCIYNKTAIFYTKNNYEIYLRIKEICKRTKYNLFCESDFYNLIYKFVKTQPDLIIIDGYSLKPNNFPFYLITNEIFKNRSKVVIISDNFVCDNKVINVVKLDVLEKYINEIEEVNFENELPLNDNLETTVNDFLLDIGFSPKLKGKDYLKLSIMLILDNSVMHNCLNKECYPIVAANFKTNLVNIDRNIRNAIKCAYANHEEKDWNKIFNQEFTETPSSREFIYQCVDKIKEMY